MVGLQAPGPIPRKRDSRTGCLSSWLFWKHSWDVWFSVSIAAMIHCNHSSPSMSKCPHKLPVATWIIQFVLNWLFGPNGNQTASFVCFHPLELPVVFVVVWCCTAYMLLLTRRTSVELIWPRTRAYTLLKKNVATCGPDHLWMWFEWSDLSVTSMRLGCVYTCTQSCPHAIRSLRTHVNTRSEQGHTVYCGGWAGFSVHVNVWVQFACCTLNVCMLYSATH